MALGQLVIDLNLNMAKFVSGIGQVNQHLTKMQRTISVVKGSAFVYLGQQAYHAGQQIFNLAKTTVDWADDLVDTAKAIGVTTSALQRWQYIAQIAGVDQRSLSLGLRSFINNMDDAKKGTGEAATAFKEAGITSTDLQTALLQAAGTFSNMVDGTDKAALAMKLFGSRAGLVMIELMNLGEKGISAAITRMKELGLEFSDEKINKLASYKDKVEQISMAWRVFAVDATPIALKGLWAIDVAIKVLGKAMEGLEYPIERLALAFQAIQRSNLQDTLSQIKSLKESLAEAGDEAEKARIREEIEKLKASMRDVKIGEKFQEFKEDLIDAAAGSDKLVEDILTSFKNIEPSKWIKEWVTDFDELAYRFGDQMQKLGIVSEQSLVKAADSAKEYVKEVEKLAKAGKATSYDLIQAYNAASEAMKLLPKTAQQVAKEIEEINNNKTKNLLENEEDYQKKIKEIDIDDPDRAKKIQAVIDDWSKARKKIFDDAQKSKIELQITSDTTKAKENLEKLIKEYTGKEIPLIITTTKGGGSVWNTPNAEGNLPYMTPEGTPTYESSEANVSFTASGLSPKIPLGEAFNKIKQEFSSINDVGNNLNANIAIYGMGSTRKPIIDKIHEIIQSFGGIDKALAGMEAEINLSELTAEYDKLSAQLESVKNYPTAISSMLSAGGNPFGWYNISPEFWRPMREMIAELTSQMNIIRLKMEYETLKAYGGGMQSGGYVGKTGYYKLHEGERVVSKSVSMGNININIPSGTSKEQAKEIARQLALVLKYKRSGDLAEYV